jgi:hypothetical protein
LNRVIIDRKELSFMIKGSHKTYDSLFMIITYFP